MASPPRLLLVDDRPNNLIALRAVLSPLGADLATAPSGEEALRLLLQQAFSLLVLDVHLPGLDGISTARLLRSHPGLQRLPILFLSADPEVERRLRSGVVPGPVEFLPKPVDGERLCDTVRRLLAPPPGGS